MQGAGNDYIYVDTLLNNIPDPASAAIRWSAPHTGIGADGLVLIGRADGAEADFTMRIFNADGSEALMCGNAARCVGKYLYEKGITGKTLLRLLTPSGVKLLRLRVGAGNVVESVTVDMLAPVLADPGLLAAPYPKLVLLANNEPPATWRDTKGIIAFASLTPRPDAQLIGPMAIVNWLTELLLTTNPEELIMSNDTLTHFNAQHRAKMVDVTDKQTTSRKASATGQITMHPATLARIKEGKVKKGDVLAVAQVAGIMAAKKTSELIPMCHLIPLTGVDLSFSDNRTDTITVTSTVKTKHVTGVEIEALTAVQICLLTIYDMCKAMDRGMVISDVHLLEKEGGKSGHFVFQP